MSNRPIKVISTIQKHKFYHKEMINHVVREHRTTLTLIYLLLRVFPSPCVKKLIVTLILSSKANVSNGSSVGAEAVKTTLSDIMWPSITFLSIISGLGCGYKFDETNHERWEY